VLNSPGKAMTKEHLLLSKDVLSLEEVQVPSPGDDRK
jgi:hypothetical protein